MDQDFDLIIKNGFVVLPGEVVQLDIGISAGCIAALSENLNPDACPDVLDAAGQYVFPGIIDMHVHFNEPSFGHWEGFETGSASLAAGGCTTYADMPLNGNPPTVNEPALSLKADKAAGKSAVDYTFWGGLVPDNLDELEKLHAAGVIGFKAFISNPGGEGEGRFREVDDRTLYQGMQKIAAFGGILALHAESDTITSMLGEEAKLRGQATALDFAASRPPLAELEAVSRALLYGERTGCRLHFVHISTAAAVELICEAKQRGQDVSVETCPHYLVLCEEDMERVGPLAKCAPPLRSKQEREKLWEALAVGKFDFIASDHSPCPPELKIAPGLSFFDAWGGISGAQSSLELLFHEGVNRRGLPVSMLARLLAERPAARFGLNGRKGAIAVGKDADLAILHPDFPYKLTADHLLYRHKQSPYIGMELSCRVTATLLKGRLVYTLEEGLLQQPAGGNWIKRAQGVQEEAAL